MTRKEGPGEKLGGGGNVSWTCNFCKNEFKSTYYRVKGHLLALLVGFFTCKAVSVTQRRDMGKEDQEGLNNVASTSKKNDEDPLPFLRKPSSIRLHFHLAEVIHIQQERGFQQEGRQEVDLTIALFFYLNFISFNVARSPLFIEMRPSLIE